MECILGVWSGVGFE